MFFNVSFLRVKLERKTRKQLVKALIERKSPLDFQSRDHSIRHISFPVVTQQIETTNKRILTT